MTAAVRNATRRDAPRIAKLVTQLGYPVDAQGAGARLRRWLDAPQSRLLLAESDGVVSGLAAWHLLPHLEHDGWWARLAALVVDDDWRGKGVGRLLVKTVEAEAAERGCTLIEVTSSRERTGAHAFYRMLGYRDRCAKSGRFLKPLRPRPDAVSPTSAKPGEYDQ
ncbi:MAG: GNAT family N-acetyltransferase [Stackebrandtia sp.]